MSAEPLLMSAHLSPDPDPQMPRPRSLSSSLLLSALVACALLLSTATDAEARRPLHEKEQFATLVSFLSAHEFKVSEGILRSIGPDVNRLLVHVSGDPNQRPSIRQNALRSLVVFPTDRTRRFLETQLNDPGLIGTPHGLVLRRQAMLTYGTAFGQAAVAAIADLARDTDPQVREGAAGALAATRSESARRILDAWLPHEPELFVRLAVDRALETMRRASR